MLRFVTQALQDRLVYYKDFSSLMHSSITRKILERKIFVCRIVRKILPVPTHPLHTKSCRRIFKQFIVKILVFKFHTPSRGMVRVEIPSPWSTVLVIFENHKEYKSTGEAIDYLQIFESIPQGMAFFLEITNIWQKSQEFWFVEFFS